jgi:type II secretory pathway pseudopilin PulG
MPAAPSRSSAAFSLIEVVVAVGIFAIAIVSIVGLLVPIRNSVSDVRDTDDAARLATLIQSELQKQSFPTIAGFLDSPPSDMNRLFASRDATKVGVGTDNAKWGVATATFNPDSEKFFLIELTRNTALSPNATFDATSGYLAFTIKLTWPAFASTPPGGSIEASSSQQSTLLLPAAITR